MRCAEAIFVQYLISQRQSLKRMTFTQNKEQLRCFDFAHPHDLAPMYGH
jgi:hypothetical protein